MPTRETADAFIALVASDRHLEAIETFYLEDAFTRENLADPLVGKAAILAKETQAIASVKSVKTQRPLAVVHDGDRTVIHWVFDIIDAQDRCRRLEELALVHWRGERIVSEQFFYDSATAWRERKD